MANLFISYSRSDSAFAHKLHDTLVAAGHDVWVDWEDIPPTAERFNENAGAIDKADAVLLLVSTPFVASTTCAQEIAHAADRHKRLIPIAIETIRPAGINEAVAKVQWIFCRPTDDFDAGM